MSEISDVNGPAQQNSVIDVQWQSEEAKKKYEAWITNEISASLIDRSKYDEDCEKWLRQYLSRSKYNSAGGENAQFDFATTRKIFLQNQSRVISPLFASDKMFTCQTSIGYGDKAERLYEQLIDIAQHKRSTKLRKKAIQMYRNAQIYGIGCVKIGFTVEYESVQTNAPSTGDVREVGPGIYERRVQVTAGSFPQVIPIMDMLFPWYATTEVGIPWLGDIGYYTDSNLAAMEHDGVFPQGTKKRIGEADTASKRSAIGALLEKKPSVNKYHKIAQVYASFDINGDGLDEEIVSWVHIEKKIVIRTVHNWFREKRKPYVFHRIEEREDMFPGYSLAFMIEAPHRARSVVFQQRIDAATRANNILLLIRKGADVLSTVFKNNQLRSGVAETNIDLSPQSGEIREIKLSQPFTQLPQLEEQLEREALETSALAMLNLGREETERPTVYGQQTQIREAQFPIGGLIDDFAETLEEIMSTMLARYVQFFPQGVRTLEPKVVDDVLRVVEKTLTFPPGTITENIAVRTVVSSATMNRDMRKMEKEQLVMMMPQIMTVMQELGQRSMAMMPDGMPNPLAPASLRLLDVYTNIVADWLTEHVTVEGDPTKTPDIRMEVAQGAQLAPMVYQMAQQISQMQQMLQQLTRGQQGAVQGNS